MVSAKSQRVKQVKSSATGRKSAAKAKTPRATSTSVQAKATRLGKAAVKLSPRAQEGKALRSTRGKATRYAARLEKMGYAEEARRLRQTAGLIYAGRGRGYSDEARAAARSVAAESLRAREVIASTKRFQREARSARRGLASPLSQGLGLTDLSSMPAVWQTRVVRKVSKRGRVTERTETRNLKQEALRARQNLMEGLFYKAYQTGGLDAGDGFQMGWQGAEGDYPGSADRLGTIAMATGAASALDAWRKFWRDPENQDLLEAIDRIALAIATDGTTGDELLDQAIAAGDIETSPIKQYLAQKYGLHV